jgi:hypothetical protein
MTGARVSHDCASSLARAWHERHRRREVRSCGTGHGGLEAEREHPDRAEPIRTQIDAFFAQLPEPEATSSIALSRTSPTSPRWMVSRSLAAATPSRSHMSPDSCAFGFRRLAHVAESDRAPLSCAV